MRQVKLGEFLAKRSRGIVSAGTPGETFELYSVPAFEGKRPEVVVGGQIGSNKQIVDPGCMKCMDCVSVCPTDALSFGFAKPKPFTQSQNRIKARADFTWPEEIALGVVAWTATMAFRGAWFGEHVPFLLAVGLGIVTAVFVLLAWRLVRRRDVTFQHTTLKKHGAMAGAGKFATVRQDHHAVFGKQGDQPVKITRPHAAEIRLDDWMRGHADLSRAHFYARGKIGASRRRSAIRDAQCMAAVAVRGCWRRAV